MRSALTDTKPFARAASMTVIVSASDWIRLTAFCTSGSKSWMPTEIRLKPSDPRNAMVSASTLRGSTSIETSASGATLKAPRSIPISVAISSRARNVGVPPPKMQLLDLRAPSIMPPTLSISRPTYLMYFALRP